MHCSLAFVDHSMHLSKIVFYVSICFQKLKSSSTRLISASLCEGSFFYFYVESVFLSNLYLSSKRIVSIEVQVYYMLSLCLTVKTLYWHYLKMNKLQVEASCWKLKSSFVLVEHLCRKFIALWTIKHDKSYNFHVSKVLSMKNSSLDVTHG